MSLGQQGRRWDRSDVALTNSLPAARRFSARSTAPAQAVLSLAVGSITTVLVWTHREAITFALASRWRELLFWTVLVLLVNFVHFEMAPLQFTLDMPLLLAIAMLYHPATALGVALIGSADAREFRGRVSLARGIYNRAQIGISVYFAALAYDVIPSSNGEWPAAVAATVVAMAVFYALNVFFVAAFVAAGGADSPREVLKRLAIGRPLQYALTYFGYGMLGLVLARLFADVGAWSVALFLVPIVVAHTSLVRAERLRMLADQLRSRERLLEKLSERIVDERRDERGRIARGLHDDVLQSLIRISQLGSFLRGTVDKDAQAGRDVSELVDLSSETILTLREVVGDLRKSPLGRGGLVRTLQDVAGDLQIQWRIPITVEGPSELDLSSDIQLAAYHVAKEGILNALKHSECSAVGVVIDHGPDGLSLTICDDGVGFDPRVVDESRHFGLGLMRERIERLGGTFGLETWPGRGSRLRAVIPPQGITAQG
jgi:signal transduction histidine kinase